MVIKEHSQNTECFPFDLDKLLLIKQKPKIVNNYYNSFLCPRFGGWLPTVSDTDNVTAVKLFRDNLIAENVIAENDIVKIKVDAKSIGKLS